MADHLNVPGAVPVYCFNERDFVRCGGNCGACPSFIGRTLDGRGYVHPVAETDAIAYLLGEILYHKKCAWENAQLDIKRVIFNPPATIVFWTDGTKTVVKVHDEPFDREKGIAMALVKKMGLGKKFRITIQEPKKRE